MHTVFRLVTTAYIIALVVVIFQKEWMNLIWFSTVYGALLGIWGLWEPAIREAQERNQLRAESERIRRAREENRR